jgi:hypothetical protein
MKIEFGPDMPDVTTETLTFPHPDVTGGVVWTPAGGFPDPALMTTTKDPWSIFNEVHSSITPAAVSEILGNVNSQLYGTQLVFFFSLKVNTPSQPNWIIEHVMNIHIVF